MREDTDSRELARRMRIDELRMVHAVNASHIGTALSATDLLAVLYSDVLRVDPGAPELAERDRLIFSKGHGAAALYAVLAEVGFFPVEMLTDYCKDGSNLMGHVSHLVPGVELSTGSLGHGLPVGCGMALAAKRLGNGSRCFVVCGDGEMDEGSVWESLMFAPQHGLDNLVLVIDRNRMQAFGDTSEIMDLEPLSDKLRSFRWNVRDIDGHDHDALRAALGNPSADGAPVAVIANTTKGKGVSFMENRLEWHYRSPNDELLRAALLELGVEE